MNGNNEYFKKFKEDINCVWTKKLVTEFDLQNDKIYRKIGFKHLEIPNFVISFSEKHWGTWCPATRTLMLSDKLLRNHEWDAVVHTLKHEMAHMVVSEIWGDISDNGNSHGELFKKACEILEVDSKRCHSGEDLDQYQIPEKDSIISKVYKLFCLGESNHKSEAELAIAKAHELMIKHNISLKELPKEKRVFVARPVGEIYKNVPTYVKRLSRIVSEYYFVKHIFCSSWDHGRKRGVEMYGEPENIDIAEYVYHFLLHEGDRQWKEFQKSDEYQNRFKAYQYHEPTNYGRRRGGYSKIAFLTGLYDGFEKTLEKRNEEVKAQVNEGNKLPICLDDPLLEEKYNDHYHPCTWHSGGGSSGIGYGEGHDRGQSIKIRQGVATGSIGGRMLLNA